MVDRSKNRASSDKIRILIVDDHAVVRQGLTRLVENESDLTVSAEAENAIEALNAIKSQEFDLAIVDISLEDNNGLDLTAEIKSRRPNITILILSMHDGLLYAKRALGAGATGYVVKYEAPEKIISAIRQVLSGKVYVSESKAAKSIRNAVSGVDDELRKCEINEIPSRRNSLDNETNHA